MTTKYKTSLKDQKVTIVDTLVPGEYLYIERSPERGNSNALVSLTLVLVGVFWGMIIMGVIKACDKEPQPATIAQSLAPCHKCHNRKTQMTEYFRMRENPYPEKMAEAVLATSKPKLLAAVAVAGEKNTPYTVRRGGYKKRHAGAWQVNSKYWGKVPHNPIDQAKQAENILVELTNQQPLRKALSQYGGDSTNAYQRRVLAELSNVP